MSNSGFAQTVIHEKDAETGQSFTQTLPGNGSAAQKEDQADTPIALLLNTVKLGLRGNQASSKDEKIENVMQQGQQFH